MSDDLQPIAVRARAPGRRRLRGRVAVGLAVTLVLAACSAAGDGAGGGGGGATSGPSTTVTAATDPAPGSTSAPSGSTGPDGEDPTTTTAPSVDDETETEWTGEAAPSEGQQVLLDALPDVFAPAAECRPIADDTPDALGTYPQGPDDATIECEYPGHATVVYSRFPGDAAMRAFFDGRLEGRQLPAGTGEIGPTAPWAIDYADDAERGSGSIFGYQRTGDGARSEIGFVRAGTRIYAYSYALGTDFAGYYAWWASVFGGPAPPA